MKPAKAEEGQKGSYPLPVLPTQHKKTENQTPTAIFLYSLADHRAGRHIGAWVDVTAMNDEELQQAIKSILSQSPDPNAAAIAIADYEGFYGLTPSIAEVLAVAERLHQHGEAYAGYCRYQGITLADEEDFLEAYNGEWHSFLDFASDLFDDIYLHDFPKHLQPYIDYDKFARDLILGGDYHTEESSTGGVYVYRCY